MEVGGMWNEEQKVAIRNQVAVGEVGVRATEKDKWSRVDLQRGDWMVLRCCHEHRFGTFGQTCWIYGETSERKRPERKAERRLSKLQYFDYIQRAAVHTERHRVVLLGRRGFRALCEAGFDLGLPFLASVDPASFRHDKELTNLRFFLEKEKLQGEWRSERVLRHVTGKRAVPDADLIWKPTGERIALELERTHKNLDRYRRIFKRHLHSRYPWILYVMTDAKHLAWLFRSALPRLERDACWGIEQPPMGRLRFVMLDVLMARGVDAPAWQKRPGDSTPVRVRLGGAR
jgi:hypothetical protein